MLPDKFSDSIKKYTRIVEKVIVTVLIVMMSAILLLATVQLVIFLIQNVGKNGELISLDGLMDTFGVFLLILIGIELLETIKIYLRHNIVHVEVVILVAIIALARKIVILRVEELDGTVIAAIGILILALGAAYYFIKRIGLLTLDCDDETPGIFGSKVPKDKNNNTKDSQK